MDSAIKTTGTIVQALSTATYRVALPNGKIVFGHCSKTLSIQRKEECAQIPINTLVSLELTPFDFEKARITALLESPLPSS